MATRQITILMNEAQLAALECVISIADPSDPEDETPDEIINAQYLYRKLYNSFHRKGGTPLTPEFLARLEHRMRNTTPEELSRQLGLL